MRRYGRIAETARRSSARRKRLWAVSPLRAGLLAGAALLAVAAGVALAFVTRGEEPVAVAAATTEPRAIEVPAEPREEPAPEPPREKPEPATQPVREVTRKPPPEPPREPAPEPAPEPAREPVPQPARAPSSEAPEELPVRDREWQRPTPEEEDVAEEPRRYPVDRGASLTLTIEALGLYRVPVINDDSPQALARGVIHEPETPMPWNRDGQKNVYLAGHRLGYPGSGSRLVFYHLGRLSDGDEVILRGRGATYEYRVTEMFRVSPHDEWVMDPVRDRDIVTLQTCTGPGYSQRLIVRADRVLSAAAS